MRKLLLPLAIVAIAAGPASMAMAGAKTAPKPQASASASVNPKTASCEKQWKAEKKHSQTKKAFLAACEAKA